MRNLMLILALFLAPLVQLQAAEPPATNNPFPLRMVRILALSGTGPDNAEHTLYASRNGFATPLQEVGRIGYLVQGKGLADGHYHTLYVALADDFQEIYADGTVIEKRLSDTGKERHLRIRGMVLVADGQATPMGMLEYDTPRRLPRGMRDDDDD